MKTESCISVSWTSFCRILFKRSSIFSQSCCAWLLPMTKVTGFSKYLLLFQSSSRSMKSTAFSFGADSYYWSITELLRGKDAASARPYIHAYIWPAVHFRFRLTTAQSLSRIFIEGSARFVSQLISIDMDWLTIIEFINTINKSFPIERSGRRGRVLMDWNSYSVTLLFCYMKCLERNYTDIPYNSEFNSWEKDKWP